MLFPFTGPFLDAIMGGGRYIHIFMLATVKTIAFKRNPSGRRRIYESYTYPNYRARNGGPVPLIKRLNLHGLNEHMAEV